jgi:hypothetical protein
MSAGPFYRAHQLYDGSFAVVHLLPGPGALPDSQRGVSIDVEGFATRAAAEKEAAWMNLDRQRDEARWANSAGLRGVSL